MRSDRPAQPPESEDPRNDSEFQELLANYVEEVQAVGFIDPDEILRDHPDLGPAILEDLETYVQLLRQDLDRTPIGTLGDYTLRRQIGRGGMGVVYEAWQGTLDRQVALKVLPAGIAADDKAFLRFMREAKTAAKLNHRNVVSVYGMGVEQNTPYYSMELVDGETLAKILARIIDAEPGTETPFGPKESVEYFGKLGRCFADVADGLQHAHSRGVIHRDVKPSNLILDGDGRLRILDFGLARLEGQESLTLSGDFIGTPLYMSPEQARRRKIPIDHRTDVYSLGATMYEAVCGCPPFRGKDHADTLSQIIEREPAWPRKLNLSVPRDLETIILKCLRKDVDARYGSAEALEQDLRRLARGDAIEAHPETLVDRWTRRVIRHRLAILFAVCLLLSGIVAILAHSFLVGLERDRAAGERDRAQHTAYVAHMRLAQGDWDDGNTGNLFETLELYVPSGTRRGEIDRRGWEWYYLHHLPRRGLLRELPGTVFQWSRDGRLIAATRGGADTDRRVMIYEAATGKRILEFDDLGPVMAASFNADGTRLTTYGWWDPPGVRVRDAKTGELLVALEPVFEDDTVRHVRYLDWHPDGRRIALASQLGEIQIWDAIQGRYLARPLPAMKEPERVWHIGAYVTWSPDGRRLARVRRGEVVILEAREPDSWHQVAEPVRTGGYKGFGAWSPDGSIFAVSGEGEIVFWNATATEELGRVSGLYGADRFDWSPDGKRIACGLTGSSVAIIDVASREVMGAIQGHTDFTWNSCWCPRADSSLLATSGRDQTVRLWDVNRLWGSSIVATAPQAFAWSPSGRFQAVVDGPVVELSKVTAETERQVEIPDHDWSIGIRVDDGQKELTRTVLDRWSMPSKIEFSHDDELIAACGTYWRADARVGVWSWRDGKLLWERPSPSRLVSWRPQGNLLATGDGTDVVLRAAGSGEEMVRLRGHERDVCDVAWRPDGQVFASGSGDYEVRLWSLRVDGTWTPSRTFDLNELGPYPVYGASSSPLVWSRDGRRLFAGGGPGIIWVFDPDRGTELTRVRAHSTRILSLDLSPGGRRLASSDEGGTVRVWGLDRENQLDQLLVLRVDEGDVRRVLWHPDGKRLAALAWAKAIHVWEAPEYASGSR